MKKKRTDLLDQPTLDELRCLIMHDKDTKGHAAESVLLTQLYAFCLQHGYGRVFQMVEGMYEIWGEPDKLKEYQRAQSRYIAYIRNGIKVFDQDGNGHDGDHDGDKTKVC